MKGTPMKTHCVRLCRQPVSPFLALYAVLALSLLFTSLGLHGAEPAPRTYPLTLTSDDVLPTGNEWVAMPTLRASDAALTSLNVLSMRDRGLLEAAGQPGSPLLQPYFSLAGERIPLNGLDWKLIEYWIPTAHLRFKNLELSITYCAPPGIRGALIHMTATNRGDGAKQILVSMGLKASWGGLNRVTYTAVGLRGERTVTPAPWVDDGESFGFITHDTQFAWSLLHPGVTGHMSAPPAAAVPEVDVQKEVTLAPGQSAETDFVIGVGVEEFSATHSAEALVQLIDREGADSVITESAMWCRRHTRTTGRPDLDMVMNRNYLFTALYAWGRTLDTEQLVGVTSRSPRYYVSAAYWDRDAMLWSFPGLLDIDPSMAREALAYALTTQLRNTGTHSRFIDGIVLEDGFQLDEAVAPILALADYVRRTNDVAFLTSHTEALAALRDRFLSRFDRDTGLYSTLQDSQDEYQKQPFFTYGNVLTWRALLDLGSLYERLKDGACAQEMRQRGQALHEAILREMVFRGAEGTTGPIFACMTDGKKPVFADVPPGSLLKLPALGFVREDDPVFAHTYQWLHSQYHKYSFSQEPYGLPGSYRLPFTTSWSIADHLQLTAGRDQALKLLHASGWDGGIVSEGVDPKTAAAEYDGRAFATAAGYLAHSICETFCVDRRH